MLSQSIYHEIQFLLHSFLLGAVITFVYDNIRVLRRVIRHNVFFVSLEDLVFWIAVAISIFLLHHRENNGIFRWFSILGALVGMLLYRKLFSSLYVKNTTIVLGKLLHILYLFFATILFPVYFVEKKILQFVKMLGRKIRHAASVKKIRLTSYKKMIKMTLCKHKKRRKHEQKDSRT